MMALISSAVAEHSPVHDGGLALNDNMFHATMRVGSWIMALVDQILGWFNLGRESEFAAWIYLLVVFAISVGIGYILTLVVKIVVTVIHHRIKSDIYDNLYKWHFFSKLCHVITPIVFLILIQVALNDMHHTAMVLSRITGIYISIVLALAVSSLIDALWNHIDTRQNRKKLPLTGLVQLVKGVLWLLVIITDVAIIVDKSPASLLAGLGAFAAVLMLVFKDSILGVVAGVQLSENDSLHVGDWIKVDGTNANGTVAEVTLTTVKVMNFDKTVTSLPPYSLISGSFTNYRSMVESNTRRIMRSWMVDADSIVPLDDALKASIAAAPLMADYFKSTGKTAETNLGAFRAYLEMYLASNPHISHDDLCFVNALAQTSGGVPVQLYCFTNTSNWVEYEHIQSEVFEHVAVMMAKFNLYTFEDPSGRDTIVDGYMSNGRIPDNVLGVPYPFYMGSDTPENPGKQPASMAPKQG